MTLSWSAPNTGWPSFGPDGKVVRDADDDAEYPVRFADGRTDSCKATPIRLSDLRTDADLLAARTQRPVDGDR